MKTHPSMLNQYLGIGMEFVLLLKNKNRIKIIELLLEEKEQNITQISEKIKCAYNNTLSHLKKLEKYGIIKKEKMKKKKGQEVIISLTKEYTDDLPSVKKILIEAKKMI